MIKTFQRVTLAALLAVGLSVPAWSTDINQSDWNPTDSSNTTAAPDGVTDNTAPSNIDDVIRAIRGAVKRTWNRFNCTTATAGSSNAYTVDYTPDIAGYVNGERYCLEANFSNTASATLNIDGKGATTIQKHVAGTLTNLSANDILSGDHFEVEYDSSSGVFVLLSNYLNGVPIEANIEVITADGTYTAPSDLVYAIVFAVGGGGGGGGADASTTAGACGGGGAGGSVAYEYLTAAEIGTSQSVDVGAAGTAGSTSGGNGGAGADTTFGALLTGSGGNGGGGSGSNTDNGGQNGASAVAATGGDVNITGEGGGACITVGTSKILGSVGGNAAMGMGTGGKASIQTGGSDNTGNDGAATGCGGGGAGATDDDNTGSAGGAGDAGCVIVWEFKR